MAAAQPITTGQTGQVPAGQIPNGHPVRAAAGSGPSAHAASAGSQLAVAAPQERALVPALDTTLNADDETNSSVFGAVIARLPVELDVAIPLRGFRVKDLLSLEPGRLIESEWSNGNDLPLAAGEVQLAWVEFEVIETALVVRLTRLV